MERTHRAGRSTKVARRELDRRIVACKEDTLVEEDAMLAAQDEALRTNLHALASERAAFVRDLRAWIRALGGIPAREATALACLPGDARASLESQRARVNAELDEAREMRGQR